MAPLTAPAQLSRLQNQRSAGPCAVALSPGVSTCPPSSGPGPTAVSCSPLLHEAGGNHFPRSHLHTHLVILGSKLSSQTTGTICVSRLHPDGKKHTLVSSEEKQFFEYHATYRGACTHFKNRRSRRKLSQRFEHKLYKGGCANA